MLITKGQRVALLLAAAAVFATVVLPPWKYVGYPMTIVAGYSWIWSPIGQSPCRLHPTTEDLDALRARPEHLPEFTRYFGCGPDQVDEQPSDIAWHLLAIEWAAILLVAGLVVASLHRWPRATVSETAIQLSKPTKVAEPPTIGPLVSASSAPAAGLSGVARRLGVPLRTVIGKIAYLAAILFGGLATAGVATTVLRTYGWKLGGVGYVLIAISFGRWMRHVYRSEGGQIAALILFTGGFALALIVLVVSRMT